VVDVEKLKSMWEDNTLEDLAEMFKVTPLEIYTLGRQMKLSPRDRPHPDEISQQVIEERAAEVRAKWTVREERRRFIGGRSGQWKAPTYRIGTTAGVIMMEAANEQL
jgi:hypothetical protein